jgi:hypothetical protein
MYFVVRLPQPKHDAKAAKRLFGKLLKKDC